MTLREALQCRQAYTYNLAIGNILLFSTSVSSFDIETHIKN